MIAYIAKAYEDAMGMLEDGIRKTPDTCWRSGYDEYLIPVRLAYHILKGLEWLTREQPQEEFLKTRRFQLNWLGPVEAMPAREETLEALEWVRGRVEDWLNRLDPDGPEGKEKVERALYLLRHTQHHVGEYSVISRLVHFNEPEWK